MVTCISNLCYLSYHLQGVQGGKGEQGPAGPPGFQVSQWKHTDYPSVNHYTLFPTTQNMILELKQTFL